MTKLSPVEKIIKYSATLPPGQVLLKASLKKHKFASQNKTHVYLGETWDGQSMHVGLDELGSVLVVGGRGAGKTSFFKALIASLCYNATPSQMQFLLVTPTPRDFVLLKGSRYLYAPIYTSLKELETNLEKLTEEMHQRYKLLELAHVHNIYWYNRESKKLYMPYVFVFLDNYSQMVPAISGSKKKNLEKQLLLLLQLARAVGIYIYIATELANAKILNPLVRANFTNVVGFKTATRKDSRDVVWYSGCEQLQGKGDAIMRLSGNAGLFLRVQTPYIPEAELKKIIAGRERVS